MIDVKIIKKPKNKATTPTVRTPGAAYGDKSVKEAVHASKADTAKMAEKAIIAEQAEHAKKADEATRADEVSLESKTLSHFLRNDIPNTAAEVVTFLKGVIAKTVSFFQGIVNKGDITNSGTITTKNLNVTGKATFFELMIQITKAAGGMTVYSPGAFHIDAVKDAGDYFACFQRAEKDGVKLRQMCDIDDQLMCARFNVDGNGNKFYWMRVSYISSNTVQHVVDGKLVDCLEVRLDKSVKSDNCQGVPEIGDALAVFGNRTKEDRQSVIVISAYNSFDIDLHAPYIAQYEHVNDFNLESKKTTWLSKGGNNLTGTFTVVSGGKYVSLDDFVTKISQATFKVEADRITARIDGVEKTQSETTKKYSELQATVNSISTTVARKSDLEDVRTEIKQTAESFSLTVANGTRPNLLWGSDLDLSEMQDKIQFAYEQGTDIKQKTAEKENLQRQLDATPTNDTAKRNDLQKKINACDNGINTARNKVSECKEAIQKHLGVGLNATRVDSTEWFEYLKGGGVAGADAIKAKVAAVNGEGNYYAGLYWQTGFGAKQHIKVKPNTKYTFSFWIRTEILQGSGYAVAEGFNMEGLHGGRKDRTMPWTDVKATNEWERKSYTFTTGDTGYIMVGVGLSGENDFSGLIYLCRPKLEEGDTATPWCAYDGTVEALLAGGFDIKNRKFTATADNFLVQNNRGEQTFLVDKNGNISGFRIAQPFDVYNSKEEWRIGKSYSWYIKGPIGSEDSIFSGSYLDGACVNIYNGTAEEVRLTINICFKINEYTGARSALAKLILKPAQLFRAIGVRQQTDLEVDGDYITFYPLVPFTLERTNQAYEIAKYLLRVRDVFENVMEVGESYGGIVEKLKVSGIYKNVETLIPGGGYTMKSTDTTIVADTSSYGDANITLPRNPQVGMEVEIINIGTGLCNLETADNTRIFWNEVKTKEEVAAHKKVSLLYVGGSDNLWIYTTEGVCGKQ